MDSVREDYRNGHHETPGYHPQGKKVIQIPAKDQRSGTKTCSRCLQWTIALLNLVANEISQENWPINTNIQASWQYVTGTAIMGYL
ncbi:hypothetical protein AVEN_142268-1 [Araneus ventricosus]|uniref:Uncharacterized protein n=1 Tax=Araneus ventricosus TaxID=182803 RepID=A0A4Y2GNW0_ARAVE|nr:hypothetical protein AVEN_142268-1 [Araneus ventricosus]